MRSTFSVVPLTSRISFHFIKLYSLTLTPHSPLPQPIGNHFLVFLWSFCDHLTSFSIVSWRFFTLQHVSEFLSFSELNSVSLYVCISLFIYSSANGHSAFWLFLIMWLWIEIYKYLFKTQLSWLCTWEWNCWILWSSIWIFWGITILFPTVAASDYIPFESVWDFRCLYIIATTCLFPGFWGVVYLVNWLGFWQ